MTQSDELKQIAALKPWEVRPALEAFIKKLEHTPNTRTSNQNRAMHKYFELVAEALDREGHSMQDVIEHAKKADIRPTPEAVKVVMWHPIQKAMYGTTSTKDLTTAQVDRVYEVLNKFLGEQFALHIPFPTHDLSSDILGEVG